MLELEGQWNQPFFGYFVGVEDPYRDLSTASSCVVITGPSDGNEEGSSTQYVRQLIPRRSHLRPGHKMVVNLSRGFTLIIEPDVFSDLLAEPWCVLLPRASSPH